MLNWSQHIHQWGNLEPVHIGPISYLFPTLELLSEAELFVMLHQQYGTVCRRQLRILCSHSKHLNLGWKHTYTINHSAVDHVTDPHLRFYIIVTTTYDALQTVYYYYYYYQLLYRHIIKKTRCPSVPCVVLWPLSLSTRRQARQRELGLFNCSLAVADG
jgi:hypothetical protein